MIRHDSFFKRLKRGGSLFLAVLLAVQSFFNVGFGIISADASEGENRGSTFAYYGSQNLLKEGASFPFYGKNHNRVGLWPYGITKKAAIQHLDTAWNRISPCVRALRERL